MEPLKSSQQKPKEVFNLPPEIKSAIDAIDRCTESGDHSEAVGRYLIGLGYEKTGELFLADPNAKGVGYENKQTATKVDVIVADFLGIFTDIKFTR